VLTLLEKLYGSREADARRAFEEILTSTTSGLDAEVRSVGKNARGWIQVDVSGSDSKVVINYLRRRFGLAQSFTDVRLPMVLRGKIVDSGRVGYGVYVDIGLSTPDPLDALIPLHGLRSHLADGRKLPLREIIDLFCLRDNFPFSIRLTMVDVEGGKIWAEPSDGQIELFRGWLSMHLDRVIALGAHREQVMLALRKSGMGRHIVKVDELGFLECSILCKLGTDAPGVIKVLGRHLPEVPLYAFSPRKVRSVLGELPPSLNK